MSKVELLMDLIQNSSDLPPEQIALSTVITVVLAVFIYLIYKKTYSGVVYSKSFNVSLLLVTLITSMVIMIIGSNLALSLGMVGALSIVRFRTAIKEPKDIAFLFWGIGVGLACGTGSYFIGVIVSVVIAAILLIFSRGLYDDSSYLCIVKGESSLDVSQVEQIVSKNVGRFVTKSKNISDSGIDITFELKFRKKDNSNEIVSELRAVPAVKNINIISYNGEIAG